MYDRERLDRALRSPSGRVISGEDFSDAIFADQVNGISFTFAFRSHAGGTIGHSGHRQSNRVRAIGQKPTDISGRYMAFDHIAAYMRRVAGKHFGRDAACRLEGLQSIEVEQIDFGDETRSFEKLYPG